ncbi:MAG: hypothetical protein K2X43_15000 [Hyphomonadaceae bacterium]|nr:hypothetical protein [Hyphomonadaceae bacterium]
MRRIDQKIDRVVGDVREIKVRMTNVEEGLVRLNRRMDRFEGRPERMERRLDLHDPALPG